MHKKPIFSRSRAHRLWMERLEKRSMLAADFEAGFDDFSFDWSQFDDAAWAAWSQFDDSAWSDPAVDSSTIDGGFGDQPPEGDPSWIFEQGVEEPWPAEPETSLPEAGVDDPAATSEDVWQTVVVDSTDSSETDITIVTDPIADDTAAEAAIDDVAPVDQPVAEDSVAETVTDPPLPVEPEPTTVESPLASDASNPTASIDGWDWEGQHDTTDRIFSTVTRDTTGTTDTTNGTDAAGHEAGTIDEMGTQDGAESLPEAPVSFDQDLPAQASGPSVAAAAPRQAGSSARAAAFGTMRMFPGFSFGGSNDSGDDGPIFAGGRRRNRR